MLPQLAVTFRLRIVKLTQSGLQTNHTMTKKFLLPAMLTIGCASAHAQNYALKVNTASLLAQTGSVFFEYSLSAKKSLNFGLFVTRYSKSSTLVGIMQKTNVTGFGLTGEYRFYPANNALKGFFVGPYLRFQNYQFTKTDQFPYYGSNGTITVGTVVDEAKLTTIGGGMVLGWKGMIGKQICFEPFLGLGYAIGEVDNLDDNNGTLTVTGGIRGLELRPGINIGYCWGNDLN